MNSKINKILYEGLDNLQLVLDFDRTITGPVDNHGAPPLISFLRESDMLGEEYREKAQENFKYYYPFEKSHDLTHEEKSILMKEWWVKHLKMLVEFGLTKEKIIKIVNSPNLKIRDGVKELFDFAAKIEIPIIIFSAGILGSESIKLFLERYNISFPNVKIITNELIFNDAGDVVNFKEPVIHSENKDESILDLENISQRKNTILAGDGTGDIKMVLDKPGTTVYRLGILDSKEVEEIEKYKKYFDEVGDNFLDILSIINKNII